MFIWIALAWAGPATEEGPPEGAASATSSEIAALIEQTEREPQNGRHWYDLAFALIEARQLLPAADAFARAAALGTSVAGARYNEACALALAGEHERALAAFEAAIEAGYADVRWARTDPDLSSIAGDERFQRALHPLVLVDLLAQVTGRDGVRISKQAAHEQLASLCAAGEAVPCALAPVDLSDRSALEAVLAPLCSEGSAIACLGAAWASLQPSLTGTASLRAADAVFVSRVRAACEAQIARGCTELGLAHAAGRVVYPNQREARLLWRSACRDGERRACTALAGDDPEQLAKRAADGEPVAAIAVADDVDDYERLCLDGAMIGCANLAAREGTLSGEPLAAVRGSCSDGDLAACALVVQIDAARGAISTQQAAETLEKACPILESACEEASFLAQGAPPVAGYPRPIVNPKDVNRVLFDASKPLHDCLLGALERDPSAGGSVHVILRLSAGGTVDGVYIRDPLDEKYRTCATSALRGAQIRTRDLPSRVAFTISANHGATFVVDSYNPDAGGDVTRIAADSKSWAAPFDACALRAGVGIADEFLGLSLFAGRDGRLSHVEITDGIDEPEVEACMVDFLSSHVVKDPVQIGTKLRVEAKLLQMREIPEMLPPEALPPLPDTAGPPVEIDVLALVVSRSLVDGRKARMYRGPIDSIREAHEEMAKAIEEMTGGKLIVHTDLRVIDTTIDMGELEEDDEGLQRYNIQVEDLPPALLAGIEPARWESVFVWGAIPPKFPQPALGVTYGGALVGGATFSSGVLPAGYRLATNDDLPPYELPLHEWWHQVEQRAEGYLGLGVGWPPRNHAPLSVSGRVLDPRSWLDLSEDTTIDWYRHVLGSMPRTFWADVWSGGVRLPQREGNLAARGTPFGENIRHLLGLNDTVLAFGGYPMPAEAPSAKEPPAFGLAWSAPISVGRVVLHTGGWDDPERSSWQKARLEIQSSGAWQPVEAAPAIDGATWTFTMPPVAVSALRVVVTEGVERILCREIEVYAE